MRDQGHSERTPLLDAPTQQDLESNQHHASHHGKEIMGLIYMALSALGFSTMSLFVKMSGAQLPSFEIVFARSLVQTILALLGCAVLKIDPLGKPEIRGWLILRGLAGSIGLSLFFFSITQLPLADATVVFFLGPAFTAMLAAAVLGEPFTAFDGLCSAFCMLGVVLVSKPGFLFDSEDVPGTATGGWRLFAIMCSLVGAAMSAVAYVTVRKVGNNAHFLVHVVYFGVISSLLSPPGVWIFQEFVMPQPNDYLVLILVGIFAFLGQCLLNQGLQMVPAGPGTLMRMNDVVFAFIFGIFILHEYPDIYSVLGASIIVIMTTALGLHRWYSHSSK